MPADYWIRTEVAPKLGDETVINSLAILNNKLYGGTSNNGKLYEWNGTNAWVEVAPKLGTQIEILRLAVLDDKIYGGTAENGKLYEWNGTDAWVEVAPQPGAETFIDALAVFNGKLYGGTYPNGKLYEWNGTDAWVEVAPKLGTETYIRSLAVLNGKIYGGTAINGKLYEWNGTDAWVEVAPKLEDAKLILSLAVYDGKIYGGTANNGKLYEWNGTDAWVAKALKLGDETRIECLIVFNNKIYGGTWPNGKLYAYTRRSKAFRLKDSNNNLLYTFPIGFHLESYRMAKRSASTAKALQHGGDIIGDKKYELLHLSLTGTLGAYSLADFEAACSQMKRAIHNENLRLYDAYKTDQYFVLKALEDADWDFMTDGGLADVVVNFVANPFRYDENLSVIGPIELTESGLTQAGLCVMVTNAGDIETSPVILYSFAGVCQSSLEIENLNTSRTFYYDGQMLPGDELEVDCENALVTLNGDLVTYNVRGISGFFNLEPGDNYIRVRATGESGLSPSSIQHSFHQKYF